MTIASFVISCIAVVASMGAVWYSRGQKLAADRAVTEAKRAADSAAEMVQIEQDRRDEELADTERRRVLFVLDHAVGHAYVLRNAGSDVAYDVHVDTEGLGTVNELTHFAEFQPGFEHRYVLSRTMGQDGSERVAVTWHNRQDRSDEPQTVRLLGP